jgi:hypothetical protein
MSNSPDAEPPVRVVEAAPGLLLQLLGGGAAPKHRLEHVMKEIGRCVSSERLGRHRPCRQESRSLKVDQKLTERKGAGLVVQLVEMMCSKFARMSPAGKHSLDLGLSSSCRHRPFPAHRLG